MMLKIFISEKMKFKKICYFIPLISSLILILFTCIEWYGYFRKTSVGIYGVFNVLYLFLPFMMLLTITILSSIIAEIEHKAGAWKVIFSLPLRQSKIYICKLIWISLFMLENLFFKYCWINNTLVNLYIRAITIYILSETSYWMLFSIIYCIDYSIIHIDKYFKPSNSFNDRSYRRGFEFNFSTEQDRIFTLVTLDLSKFSYSFY